MNEQEENNQLNNPIEPRQEASPLPPSVPVEKTPTVPSPSSNKLTILLGVILVLLLGLGGYFFLNQNVDRPEEETGKNYIGNSVEECSLIKFICAEGLQYFSDDNGCGCEEVIDQETDKSIVTFKQCVDAGNTIMESFPEQCRTRDGLLFVNWSGAGQVCIQVIAPARNPETGEVREFPTPCDVPTGWEELTRL